MTNNSGYEDTTSDKSLNRFPTVELITMLGILDNYARNCYKSAGQVTVQGENKLADGRISLHYTTNLMVSRAGLRYAGALG